MHQVRLLKKHIKRLLNSAIQTFNQRKRSGEAESLMKELNEAYEILSDSEKRAKYDRERAEMKRQAEERRRQAEQEKQTQNTIRQVPQNNVPPRQNMQQPQEQEDLLGYMGNIAKTALSRQKREQRKVENAYREGYQDAYAQYWRSQGYRVKEPWTWKRVKELLKSIAIFAVVILAIWIFPPTHNFLVATYESNEMLKGVVDFAIQFFGRFFHNLFG